MRTCGQPNNQRQAEDWGKIVPQEKKGKKGKKKKKTSIEAVSEPPPLKKHEEPTPEGPAPEEPISENTDDPESSSSTASGTGFMSTTFTFETVESMNDVIHYLVSSRHLMLASPWFLRALTTNEYIEASKDPSDGRYHIHASDWDEEALFILLNIFHVQTHLVPPKISLEMFAKIAVLVDYYEIDSTKVLCRDTRNWISNLRQERDTTDVSSLYSRDTILWMFISRVFCIEKELEEATTVAIKGSRGCLQLLGLPIHDEMTCTFSVLFGMCINNFKQLELSRIVATSFSKLSRGCVNC